MTKQIEPIAMGRRPFPHNFTFHVALLSGTIDGLFRTAGPLLGRAVNTGADEMSGLQCGMVYCPPDNMSEIRDKKEIGDVSMWWPRECAGVLVIAVRSNTKVD